MALLNNKTILEQEEIAKMEKLKKKMRVQDYARTSFNLPKSLHKKMKRYAIDHDKEMKDIILESIERYLQAL